MDLNTKYLTYSADATAKKLKKRLVKGKTTYFVRFGDSELKMLSNLGHSSKTQSNSDRLREELREFVKVEDKRFLLAPGCGLDMRGYYEGLRHPPSLDFRHILAKYRPLRMFDNCHCLTIKFIYNPPWFLDYCDKLRERDPLFVGGETLCNSPILRKVFGFKEFVSFPDKDAYSKLRRKMDEIKEKLENRKVLICVIGAAGKALAGRLWKNKWDGYFLDPGSLVCAMTAPFKELRKQNMARGWMEKLVTPELRKVYQDYEP